MMRPASIPQNHNRPMQPTQSTPTHPASTPPVVKPTSRARTYRIPNTSDTTGTNVASGTTFVDAGNVVSPEAVNPTPDSFLWATREIAALDFLMNVPLGAEREIVRAGLSGERWHRHHDREQALQNKKQESYIHGDIELGVSGVIDECKESSYGIPSQHRAMSNYNLSRAPSIEDETSTVAVSTIHSSSQTSEKGSSSAHQNATITTAAGGGIRWWDKLILKDKRFFSAANQQAERREQLEMEERDLECPPEYVNNEPVSGETFSPKRNFALLTPNSNIGIPGRRLDGRDAVTLSIPAEFRTRPLPIRAVARQVAMREWEMKVAWHGIDENASEKMVLQREEHHRRSNNESNQTQKPLLDGRVFFSSKKSYPMAVFSVIKYEPQKEEAARRRKKLEELGGGGTQFVLPERDWRGISYRALLPQKEEQNKAFNRLLGSMPPPGKKPEKKPSSPRNESSEDDDSNDENDSVSISSDESNDYVPGFLDDPKMVQGRHRNVMVGDKTTGPIVSSTIQFVKPSVLKAELNKQFRERFDQWEPPKSQRKFIGAKVIDGVYTLIDPTEVIQQDEDNDKSETHRPRSGSVGERETIRMPPSLTLSKIRSLKQQALVACVRSQIELSTLALACVYFERLCLDCRVDKSNRRLSFAACLFLAAKVNESNTMIAFDPGAETKSWVKPSKKSGKIFESLIVFFTHDWNISLKQLYAAEWIVFTALGFSLKSTPSHVAFHFKRLIKVLEWDSRSYLGNEMYAQWQDSLLDESRRKERREARHELRMKTNERKLLKLQRKLRFQQSEGGTHRRTSTSSESHSKFRRHSMSTVDSTGQGNPQPDEPLPLTKARPTPSKVDGSPAAMRGILSRLARSKQESHGKELDRLAKQDTHLSASMRHSVSVPNLSVLEKESKNNDDTVDFDSIIHEFPGDGELSPHSRDDADMQYQFHSRRAK